MTNRELVFRAFDNETADRAPVGFWFHFLPEAETGDGLRDPGLWAGNLEGHRRFIEAARPDMVKIMSDGFFHYPVTAPPDRKPPDREPPDREPPDRDSPNRTPLEKPADLERLEALPPGHPWLARQAELVRAVTALVPDTPCFYNIFSPATSLRFLLGRARLLEWLTLHPEAVSGALTRMGQGLAALAESAIKAGGADGIYLSVQNPDSGRVTDENYARLIRPSDLAVLAAANGAGGRNILHICGYGGVRNRLAAWADYPAQAFSWAVHVEEVSLGRGKALFGGRCVLGGFANVPGSLLEVGARAEIEAFTADLLAEAGSAGVILGADCTIPSSIDLERLEWVRLKAASLGGPAGRIRNCSDANS